MESNKGNILIVFLAVLLLVSISATGYLYWQNQQLKGTLITPPEIRVEPDKQEETQNDSRTLLLPDKKYERIYLSFDKVGSPACSGSEAGVINEETADTRVIFRSQAKGITFKVPYNRKWFSSKYRINPFDEADTIVGFGNLMKAEGSGYIRQYHLGVLPYREVAAIVKSFNKDKANDITWGYGPVVETINAIKVIKTERGGLCGTAYEEIVGKNHNYQLSNFCQVDFQALDSIVSTMELL